MTIKSFRLFLMHHKLRELPWILYNKHFIRMNCMRFDAKRVENILLFHLRVYIFIQTLYVYVRVYNWYIISHFVLLMNIVLNEDCPNHCLEFFANGKVIFYLINCFRILEIPQSWNFLKRNISLKFIKLIIV